jgi:hypothetical protein
MSYFNENNSFEEIFLLYKYHVCEDGGFRLFASEDDCLDDDDYNCLFRKIVAVSQPQNPNIRNFTEATRNFGNDRRFFYRCFGIYLREATLRYANGTTGNEGRFWEPLADGVNRDFIRNQFGDRLWFWGNRTLRNGLQGDGLFKTIFNSFRDPELHCYDGEMAEHLMKLAVLPWNNNPLQQRLSDLISAYERNRLPSYINDLPLRGLNRSENTKRHLIFKIQDFLEFAEKCVRDNIGLETAKQELKNNFPYVRVSRHYFFLWLDSIYGNQDTRNQVRNIRHREKTEDERNLAARSAAADAQIVCTIRDGEFCYILPSRVHVADMFGTSFDDINNNDLVEIFESETSDQPLLQIRNKRFIFDDGVNETDSIFKFLALKQIAVEFNDVRITIDNPWHKGKNAFFFDELGRETNSWDGKTFYVASFSNTINRITDSKENAIQFVRNNQNSVNVYSIPECANIEDVDCLKIEFSDNSFIRVDADDPKAIHILANFAGKPHFVQQKFAQKIGVGSIEFSHLGDIAPESLAEQVRNFYAGYAVSPTINSESTDVPHLVIENISDNVLELPRCTIGEKYIPAITLLPQNSYTWVAKEGDNFTGYIKKGNIQNLSPEWALEGDLYKVHNTAETVSFSQGGPRYSLLNPNYSGSHFGTQKHSNQVSQNNAPFDIVPEGARYLFRWRENSDTYEVYVPRDKTVRECYEKLGINGAELWFGWEFEGTRFEEHFEAEPNYTPIERDEEFYDLPERDKLRNLVCCVTGEPFSSSANQSFVKYVARILQRNSIKCKWWLLHGVEYLATPAQVPYWVRNAYNSGWRQANGEFYIHVYPICLLDNDMTSEKAIELSKAVFYWKSQFYCSLLDYLDEQPDLNNVTEIVEKHMIFSMEGVNVQNVAELLRIGHEEDVDMMIMESVRRFVPKLIRYLNT